MTAYRNFTVDLPKRIAELDSRFKPIAESVELEVSYTLMKLAAAFVLPYERVDGKSGAGRADFTERQSIRKYLELDKQFGESAYYSNLDDWASLDVDNFDEGPLTWFKKANRMNEVVHDVLATVRHSVAHSNLFFGGDVIIQHVYLGSRREQDSETNKYRVIRCTVLELDNLINKWIANVQRLRTSPSLIWQELEREVAA